MRQNPGSSSVVSVGRQNRAQANAQSRGLSGRKYALYAIVGLTLAGSAAALGGLGGYLVGRKAERTQSHTERPGIQALEIRTPDQAAGNPVGSSPAQYNQASPSKKLEDMTLDDFSLKLGTEYHLELRGEYENAPHQIYAVKDKPGKLEHLLLENQEYSIDDARLSPDRTMIIYQFGIPSHKRIGIAVLKNQLGSPKAEELRVIDYASIINILQKDNMLLLAYKTKDGKVHIEDLNDMKK